MLYLDTSVLVAYYCLEQISRKVEKIILRTQQPAISYLTAVELVSALSRKIRDKTLTVADGNKIINRFHTQIEQGLLLWIPI
jgi:predicted nucleic acid-binding protein